MSRSTALGAAAWILAAGWLAAGTDNLARNKPATGSTPCNREEGPEKAVNGSVTGGTSDKWCSEEEAPFLQVDLGADYKLDRFVVKHAGAGGEPDKMNSRNFDIQTSLDGHRFTTVAHVLGNTAKITEHAVPPVVGRFVRLRVITPTQDDEGAARIYELEAYGSGVQPAAANLALRKRATGSEPCNADEGPEKAFNGSVSGGNSDKWCSTEDQPFLQVDLGADRTVVAVVVKHAGAGGESDDWNTRDFDILLSRDGKQYETAAQVTRSEARVTSHSIAPSTARFVKLVVHKPGQNDEDAARIYELEVWGR